MKRKFAWTSGGRRRCSNGNQRALRFASADAFNGALEPTLFRSLRCNGWGLGEECQKISAPPWLFAPFLSLGAWPSPSSANSLDLSTHDPRATITVTRNMSWRENFMG
jgi:hypothetical protein